MSDANHGTAAVSREDVLAKVREHFARLREETEAMPDNSTRSMLVATLDNALKPVIDHMENAPEHADMLHGAHTYLGMCHRTVIPRLPARRRSPVREYSDQIAAVVRGYELTVAEVRPAFVDSVWHLSRCLHTHAEAIVTRLEEIGCRLQEINTTLLPVASAVDGGAKFLAVLSDVDLTLTESMELLVGPLPAKSQAVRGILENSTNPCEKQAGDGEPAMGGAGNAH